MIVLCKQDGRVVFWSDDVNLARRWQMRGYKHLNREVIILPKLLEAHAEEKE